MSLPCCNSLRGAELSARSIPTSASHDEEEEELVLSGQWRMLQPLAQTSPLPRMMRPFASVARSLLLHLFGAARCFVAPRGPALASWRCRLAAVSLPFCYSLR